MLRQQHQDLTKSLAQLLKDIFAGRKELKVYRQFKMYNDPSLNPAIYQSGKRCAEHGTPIADVPTPRAA